MKKKILRPKTKKEFLNAVKKEFEKLGKENFSLSNMYHPSTLKNNMEAAELIVNDLLDGNKIVVVGDYDADGIVATYIIGSFFREIGFDKNSVEWVIPNRFTDGYGVSVSIVDKAIAMGAKTIVTVDNGISANEAVRYAKSKGLKVVITDHHTPPEILPEADIIVNPKAEGETFPFIHITGATVAWYLTAAIKQKIGAHYNLGKNVDLLGLTAISDVMPVKDINVALIRKLLDSVRKGKRRIYRAIWGSYSMPVVDEKSVAFGLVPLINATGRLGKPELALKWLEEDSREDNQMEFDRLTNMVKATNEERKKLTEEHMDIALSMVNEDDEVIVVRDRNFHEGIIGIVAGKLAEMYNKPAYVFAYSEEKKVWKGSGRTADGVHLYNLTKGSEDFILGFGGHTGAVGLSVSEENFDSFVESINEYARKIERNKKEVLVFEIDPSWMDLEFMNMRSEYAPFGEEREEPLYIGSINKDTIVGTKIIKEAHTIFYLDSGTEAIIFNEVVTDPKNEKYFIEPSYNFVPTVNGLGVKLILRRLENY